MTNPYLPPGAAECCSSAQCVCEDPKEDLTVDNTVA